jgi:TP901 family phage tail tape measure protein
MAASLNLGNLMIHLRADISQFQKEMKRAEGIMKKTSDSMAKVGRKMTFAVTAPIAAMGVMAVKTFAGIDDAMTQSLAIMGDITPEIRKQMTDLAITMSTETATSAKDLAKGYFFLASAGYDAQQAMAALGAVEKFSVAGAFDMATATDLATDAQSALGLTVKDAQQNLTNMTRVTDVLIGANTLANASAKQFAEALVGDAGPAMKSMNIELEEGVAVLAAYADQGIKGAHASSMFGRMVRLMSKGFMENKKEWEAFNINIFDTNKELKPLNVIVSDLTNALKDLATEDKLAALEMLGFKARSQQAILPLLGLGDAIGEYNEKLLKMGGITADIAGKQLLSFSNEMEIVKSNVAAAGYEIGLILAPYLRQLGEAIKTTTTAFRELQPETQRMIIFITMIVASIGPLLLALSLLVKAFLLVSTTIIGPVLSAFSTLIASTSVAAVTLGFLLGTVIAIGAALLSWKLGTELYNNFEWLQDKANSIATFLLKAWVNIKYGFQVMGIGIRAIWESVVGALDASVSILLTKLADFLDMLGVGTKGLRETAEMMAGDNNGWNASEQLAKLKKSTEDELAIYTQAGKMAKDEIKADFAARRKAKEDKNKIPEVKIPKIEIPEINIVEPKTGKLPTVASDDGLSTFGTGQAIGNLSASALSAGSESVLNSIAKSSLTEQKKSNVLLEDIKNNTEWE